MKTILSDSISDLPLGYDEGIDLSQSYIFRNPHIVDGEPVDIDKYKTYLYSTVSVYSQVKSLKGKVLLYTDDPKHAHVPVLADLANWLGNREWKRVDKENGYEVTTRGDKRFSPFHQHMKSGGTIEDIYHEQVKGFSSFEISKGMAPVIRRAISTFSRREAMDNPDILYLFTDNLNRTSGKLPIPDDSEYSRCYGLKGLMYPTMTQAVLRGLPNALPITTMKDQYKNQLTLFDNIIKVWNIEFDSIQNYIDSHQFKEVRFSNSGFGAGTYSKVWETPVLWEILNRHLYKIGIINSKEGCRPRIDLINNDTYHYFYQLMFQWVKENKALLIELAMKTARDRKPLTDMFAHGENPVTQARALTEILNYLQL